MNLTTSKIELQSNTTRRRNDAIADPVSYSVGKCTLGQLLVARGATGVCAILFGSSDEELEASLAAQFPKSTLVGNDRGVDKDLAKVVRLLDHPGEDPDFDLDLRGTPFQRRVWREIRKIPCGTTVTYSELSGRTGTPRAIRAVANACAANAIALVVPCHRVVRSDGDLGGYRWGVDRKRELIKREASV